MDNPTSTPEPIQPVSEFAPAENQPGITESQPAPQEATPNFSGTANAPLAGAISPIPAPNANTATPSQHDDEDSLAHLDQNQKASVQSSVNDAFHRNISAGVDTAVKTGNSAIIDAVHDTLGKEEFHEALIQGKKIDTP